MSGRALLPLRDVLASAQHLPEFCSRELQLMQTLRISNIRCHIPLLLRASIFALKAHHLLR